VEKFRVAKMGWAQVSRAFLLEPNENILKSQDRLTLNLDDVETESSN